MMFGVDNYLGPQIESLVILLGTLFAVLIWGYFQRRRPE
jgi:hypothetical protein